MFALCGSPLATSLAFVLLAIRTHPISMQIPTLHGYSSAVVATPPERYPRRRVRSPPLPFDPSIGESISTSPLLCKISAPSNHWRNSGEGQAVCQEADGRSWRCRYPPDWRASQRTNREYRPPTHHQEGVLGRGSR